MQDCCRLASVSSVPIFSTVAVPLCGVVVVVAGAGVVVARINVVSVENNAFYTFGGWNRRLWWSEPYTG